MLARQTLAVVALAVVGDDLGAVAARRGELHARRVRRHHDHGAHARLARGERHRLRVVARREGDDAAPLALRPSSERILFVAPRILKTPARCKFSHLKKTRRPARLVERARGEDGRAVNVAARCARAPRG